MTEKRFNYHMGLICEKKNGEYYSLTIKEVVDCLNALHEENQDLATKKEDAEYELLHLKEKYEELLEENEQLKEENKILLGLITEILDFIENNNGVSLDKMKQFWKSKEKELKE